jgi:Mrp family chromosome partitioning ATPase
MSRNFDLLAEIERERESAPEDHRPSFAADPSVVSGPSAVKVDLAPAPHTLAGLEISRLVRSLFFVRNGTSPRRVVFFGVDADSGSSNICANLAIALADSTSKSVCAVDANAYSARLSKVLGGNRIVPFHGKIPSVREQCVQIGGNLWFAGIDLMSEQQGGLLRIDELKDRLAQLSGAFDYLIIDAPGTDVSGDAEILGHLADAAVLVVEANKTRRSSAANAKESLEAAGVRLMGTILNDRSFPIPERLNKFL